MNTVMRDYGLDESSNNSLREGSESRRGVPRRVWELVQVSADPTKPGHFYAVQRLTGAWTKVEDNEYEVEWIPRSDRLPPVTRVIYCTLDEKGQIVNLNSPQALEKISGTFEDRAMKIAGYTLRSGMTAVACPREVIGERCEHHLRSYAQCICDSHLKDHAYSWKDVEGTKIVRWEPYSINQASLRDLYVEAAKLGICVTVDEDRGFWGDTVHVIEFSGRGDQA